MKRTENNEERLSVALRERGRMTVREVIGLCGVSEATARRLCARLEERGAAIRTHGGLLYLPEKPSEYSFNDLQLERRDDKRRIGEYAAAQVFPGDTIFLDAGTTVRAMADALAVRLRSGELPRENLVVFTNSIINLEFLSPLCRITLLGGEYRAGRRDVAGLIAERCIRMLRFTKCFLGADAISIDDGLMAMDIDTVRTDELLLAKSDETYVLADSGKFSRHSFISYGAVGDAAHIVTDGGLDAGMLERLQAVARDVVCVP